ncbi:MAG: hypothetical protein JWL76_863 [Thermoleophilia bacterium]|nr:hypothetical protein [Thermoleophilia bacterium]
MAMELQVAGVNVKKQSAWAVLGLGIITFGIYLFFWTYRVNREMRDIGAQYNDTELAEVKPGLSVVAMFIPIVNLVGLHRIGTRIQRVQRLTGRGADYSLGLHWLLAIFTGLWFCYAQHALSTTYDWFHMGTTPSTPLMPGQVPVPAAAAPSGPQVPGGPFVN